MDIIAFTRGVPPAESFPKEAIFECARRVLRDNSAQVLQYGNGAGFGPLREVIASDNHVDPGRVVVGQGSLQVLDTLGRVTLAKGDTVFIEQPTYDRTITLFQRAKVNLVGFALTDGQMDLGEIERALKADPAPRYFYVIPDFQNPSGAVMALPVRERLIELAHQHGFLIIEDCPYRHLRYFGEHIPAIFELAPDVTIRMSSFSKMVSPGIRTGYMILPADLAPSISKFAADTYISPSMFDQAVVVDFINQGYLKEHTAYLVDLFRPRLITLLDALDEHLDGKGAWTRPQGGYFVSFSVDQNLTAVDLAAAQEAGLALSDGRGFFIRGGERFIRLPFCALDESQIEEGIRRLARLIG